MPTPAPDFGTALSVAAYETMITTFGGKLDSYNQHVAALDDEQNDIDNTKDTLRERKTGSGLRFFDSHRERYHPRINTGA